MSVLWSGIVGVIQGVFGTINELISDFVIGALEYFENLGENLKNTLLATGSAIANSLLSIVNTAINAIMVPINLAIDGLNQVISLANKIP